MLGGVTLYAGLADVRVDAVDATGFSWPAGRGVPDCRMTNHPTPASRISADNDASSGPATPLPGDRLWFVMLSSLAQVSGCQLAAAQALHEALTMAIV